MKKPRKITGITLMNFEQRAGEESTNIGMKIRKSAKDWGWELRSGKWDEHSSPL